MLPLGKLYKMCTFDSGPFAPLCETMTFLTKPEVSNVLHCCQRRTDSWVKCTEEFVYLSHVVFEICEWTSWQKHTHTAMLITILHTPKVKVKASRTRYRALGLELIPVYRQSAHR